jgi:hypothetical protein
VPPSGPLMMSVDDVEHRIATSHAVTTQPIAFLRQRTLAELCTSFLAIPGRILFVITDFSIGDGLKRVLSIGRRVKRSNAIAAATAVEVFNRMVLETEPEGLLKVFRTHVASLIRYQRSRSLRLWRAHATARTRIHESRSSLLRTPAFVLGDFCLIR